MPAHRKLVRGVGVNDAPFHTTVAIKSYNQWLNIIGRCYGKRNSSNSSYVGCTVDPVWHSYMAFHDWFETNSRDGWHLEKDLLVEGNRVYGPQFCVMVPHYVNLAITRVNARGWTFVAERKNNPYHVKVSDKFVGRFKTEEEAVIAWRREKVVELERVVAEYQAEPEGNDPRVVTALNRIINELEGESNV